MACDQAAAVGAIEGTDSVSSPTRQTMLTALDQRLRAVAPALLEEPPPVAGPAVIDAADLLDALVAGVQEDLDSGKVWLLLAALTACLPTADAVRRARRRLELLSTRDAMVWLLNDAARVMTSSDAAAEVDLITDRPVVDVNFTARNDLSTGIQRVVRRVLPRWLHDHEVLVVRWDEDRALRHLSGREHRRVLGTAPEEPPASARRVIPWRVPVLLLEVPVAEHGVRLAGLAEFSPSPVTAIGYDCIPAVSAELVSEADREKFAEYLELVKYVDVVAAISGSAAAEFAGFVSALPAQGLSGPRVIACGLPTAGTVAGGTDVVTPPLPEVICVGTVDRRKNQIALMEAAEHLWREGREFQLRLVGPAHGQTEEIRQLANSLNAAGRPIYLDREVSDTILDAVYRTARMVVFPTLHEGFGLPVAEALSYGVPVVTSDFGSTREIAEGNGALLTDPQDVYALADAMRRLLLDDDLHAKLVEQARSRTTRSWDEYAAELWEVLVP